MINIAYIHLPEKWAPDIRLAAIFQILFMERNRKNIGVLQARLNLRTILYSCVGMIFNINHLGSVYLLNDDELGFSYRMEKDVIEWVKRLFHATVSQIEGYVTSGGTESNLFIMWSLRTLLTSNPGSCCIMVSPFTHYSIIKAAKILQLEIITIPMNVSTWSIDPITIERECKALISKGVLNIIIPITLGYSSIGTCDSFQEIANIASHINTNMHSHIALWIDASSQGLPLVFLSPNIHPFEYKCVYALTIDFHKLGNSPIPSGVVVYRNDLRKGIEQHIDYLKEHDITLSGSRPGFAAMAIWANIYSKSLETWRMEYQHAEALKNELITNLLNHQFPKKNIIYTTNTLTFALIIDHDFRRLPVWIENKYDLQIGSVQMGDKGKRMVHYKIHVMPHMSRRILHEFSEDIVCHRL